MGETKWTPRDSLARALRASTYPYNAAAAMRDGMVAKLDEESGYSELYSSAGSAVS
jgi:hypothetical protein